LSNSHADTVKSDCIRVGEAYSYEQFCHRTGLGKNSVRHAERTGLKTCLVGKRKYIRGAAWLRYLANVEGSPKWRRRAAESGGAGLVKFSVRQGSGVAVAG
jgi:hypothetical protein